MKGIILAGGNGTRLYPVTKSISKQIVPIYDKPMIYYPMSILMLAGIRDILIISTERDIKNFKELFKDGSEYGVNVQYEVQYNPNGLAEAFIIGEEFIGDSNVALVLGDNIFYGKGLSYYLQEACKLKEGALIFGQYVHNPRDFGVVEFDDYGQVLSLEEKPKYPKSKYAVPGLYFYDNTVIEKAKKLRLSNRGELEITDLNKLYLEEGTLKVEIFGRGMAWLDTGTHSSMLKASNFVEAIQTTQGTYIACLEEIAYKKGWISKEKVAELIIPLMKTGYGKYLEDIINED